MNKAKKRIYMAWYYAAHREEIRAYGIKYYVEHRDTLLAFTCRWKAEHPKANQAHERKYVAAHRAEKNARTLNRHHRKRANGGSVRREAWEDLKASYRYRCAYCHQRKPLTQDHVVPIVKGGWHVIENIVPACRSCNSSKGVKV